MSFIIFFIISLIRMIAITIYYKRETISIKKYTFYLAYAGYTPILLHLLLQLLGII